MPKTSPLDPHNRRLLSDALRPPVGYALDMAVAGTYSLDLLTLLTAQVAFTLFDWQDHSGRLALDPLALLESVRRSADRLTIFCQAGQIAVPKRYQLLYGYLEDSIVQVAPPGTQTVFHPKLWVLRFVAPDGPVVYRLLVGSRNLTFDRSWDVLLALEGPVADRTNAIAANHPLADFVASLPALAVSAPPRPRISESVDVMQRELRKVVFEAPEPFDTVRFWPIGVEGAAKWPFKGRIDRMLVVSPFLTDSLLSRLTREGEDHVLVSRLDTLQTLDKRTLKRFASTYFVHPDSELPDDLVEESEGSLNGLHAKIYVADAGWDARVWVGSANATAEAFQGNVELLVELAGAKSRCGIEAILRADDGGGLATLLAPFPAGEPLRPDPVRERLEGILREIHRQLAAAAFLFRAEPADSGQEFRLTLVLEGQGPEMPANIQLTCWPISLPEATSAREMNLSNATVARFSPVSFEAITAFLAVSAKAADGAVQMSSRFVVKLPLEGVPSDRRDRIIRSLLRDRNELIRLLLLILSEGGPMSQLSMDPMADTDGPAAGWLSNSAATLFESLLRALERDPRKLDQVARVIEDLARSPEGQRLLPQGLEAIWSPIWEARQRLLR